MQIQEGKFYRTRDGRKVGPMHRDYSFSEEAYIETAGDGRGWSVDGRFLGMTINAVGDDETIVSEWEPIGPVRTVIRKEIVDGTYGELTVSSYDATRARIHLVRNILNADEVRAAAATLTEIADALGDTK